MNWSTLELIVIVSMASFCSGVVWYSEGVNKLPGDVSVYIDEQRGATCYILKDNVSCLPSQWLYVDEMFLGEKK